MGYKEMLTCDWSEYQHKSICMIIIFQQLPKYKRSKVSWIPTNFP